MRDISEGVQNGIGLGREIKIDRRCINLHITHGVHVLQGLLLQYTLLEPIILGQSHLLVKTEKDILTCEAAHFHALAAPIQQGWSFVYS